MATEFELDTKDLTRRMDGAMTALKTEFASLRTGRASAAMLEPVHVEAYGQQMPINQDVVVQHIGFMGELTLNNPLFQTKLIDSA